jgi:hypothetical protein
MQKIKRQRQAKWAVVLWCMLLVTVLGTSVYLQNREFAPSEVAEGQLRSSSLQKKTASLYEACMGDYRMFVQSGSGSQRASYVVGGVSKLLKLDDYYGTSSEPILAGKITNGGTRYYSGGRYARVEALLEDAEGRGFEMVFWEVEGEWKMDWEHHVRYQNKNFVEFMLEPQVGEVSEFKLYVRRRHGAEHKEGLRLIFYEPKVLAGERYQQSPEVYISGQHPAYDGLVEAFERLDHINSNGNDRVIGKSDAAGLLRVRARLVFRESEEGEPDLQLDRVDAYHWKEFEPQ